jgi:hypothetical protein
VTTESSLVYEWGGVLGEVLAVLLGVWIISRGWTGFGWALVITGLIGFVASSTRLWRRWHQRSDNAKP